MRRGFHPAILTARDDNALPGEIPVIHLDYPERVGRGEKWPADAAFLHGVHNFRDFAYCEYRYEDFEIVHKPYGQLMAEVPAAFAELEKLFSEHEIRHVVHPNMGGEILRRAVSKVAASRNIPVLYESGTRYFPGKVLLVEDEMGSLPRHPAIWFQDLPRAKQDALRSYLQARREAKPRASYGNANRKFGVLVRSFVREKKFSDVRRLGRGFKTAAQFAGFAATRLLWRPLPRDSECVYYPIHFTVESNIILRSPSLVDQEPVLAYLSRILPQDLTLCIKQHPSYFAEGMSCASLCRLALRHGVRLLPAPLNSWDVLNAARAIVTIHGTAGFEGILLGRPVVVLGHPPFRGWGVTQDVSSLDELPAALDSALKQGALKEDRILDFLASFESLHFEGDWYDAQPDPDLMAGAVVGMFERLASGS